MENNNIIFTYQWKKRFGEIAVRIPGISRKILTEQLKQLEKQLWSAADNLRANSGLKANQYSTPILGLIFLRFADNIYRGHEAEINAEFKKLSGTRREKPISEIAIAKCGF